MNYVKIWFRGVESRPRIFAAIDWCRANVGERIPANGGWHEGNWDFILLDHHHPDYHYRFAFKDPKMALLFKLTCG